MICGFTYWKILRSLACHFLLSCLAAWLGYWLTSTILLATGFDGPSAGSISRHSLSVALCFALWSHMAVDYLTDPVWF